MTTTTPHRGGEEEEQGERVRGVKEGQEALEPLPPPGTLKPDRSEGPLERPASLRHSPVSLA